LRLSQIIGFFHRTSVHTVPPCRGLAEHWNVYTIFKYIIARYDLKLTDDSVAICGLLHDVCKIGVYKKGKRNVMEDNKWIEKEVWEYKDEFPYSHGEKSVYLIKNTLTCPTKRP
jgi:hypothetical protein